jgi:glutamate racemase
VHRVLGVIRPTTEIVGKFTHTGHVGIFATSGTVESRSYPIEIQKFSPDIKVFQEACPMWVPLVENNEHESSGTDFFVKKYIDDLLKQSSKIDAIILGCTHYPLLMNKIRQFLPAGITVISQGKIVADSLADYLQRHPEIEALCSKNGQHSFFTTESAEDFDRKAGIFFEENIHSEHLPLAD